MTESQPIRPILLLGAGFSRNWGGWLANEAFEYLLGCPEIRSNSRLKELLWKHQPRGGFEEALAAVQLDQNRSTAKEDLKAIESAIKKMFEAMNRGYSSYKSIEFVDDGWAWVHHFLLKFDAIFTLNQDNLLEKLYFSIQAPRVSDSRWTGWHLPGMKMDSDTNLPGDAIWVPDEIRDVSNRQPIYKLHGSSHWRDPTKGSLMILGAKKEASIQSHEILRKYAEEFRRRLSGNAAQLMVIGYGFRDQHVNNAISNAVANGLHFYVVDPRGSGLARALNETRQPGAISVATALEGTFEKGLIGASRRTLREIFGGDEVENTKVMRFFE